MLVDMLEEVYKDIETEKAASAPPTDPSADMMTKALAESNKKVEELKNKIDKLASAGSSIETNNKEPEDGTETAKESEETENENQNA